MIQMLIQSMLRGIVAQLETDAKHIEITIAIFPRSKEAPPTEHRIALVDASTVRRLLALPARARLLRIKVGESTGSVDLGAKR